MLKEQMLKYLCLGGSLYTVHFGWDIYLLKLFPSISISTCSSGFINVPDVFRLNAPCLLFALFLLHHALHSFFYNTFLQPTIPPNLFFLSSRCFSSQ